MATVDDVNNLLNAVNTVTLKRMEDKADKNHQRTTEMLMQDHRPTIQDFRTSSAYLGSPHLLEPTGALVNLRFSFPAVPDGWRPRRLPPASAHARSWAAALRTDKAGLIVLPSSEEIADG